MEEIITCFKKSFDFKGKASKIEFGSFWVFRVLIFLAICILPHYVKDQLISSLLSLLWILSIVPFFAVSVRRLHDIGSSVWLALILVFPVLVYIIFLILLFIKSPLAGLLFLFYYLLSFIAFIFEIYLVSARSKRVCYNAPASDAPAPVAPRKRMNTCLLCLLILPLPLFGLLLGIGVAAQGPIKERVGRTQRKAMLRDLYVVLQTYHQDFGSFPSVQPNATRYKQGGGVRDLYPLVLRMDSNELNEMLHPPGGQFDIFSPIPRPEEFDKNYIGWSYNSCARIGSEDPLMADQGVSSGTLRFQSNQRGLKPLSKEGVTVLLANGQVEFIPVEKRTGKILSDKIKDWSVLKD